MQLSWKIVIHSVQGDNPQIKVIVSFSPKKKTETKNRLRDSHCLSAAATAPLFTWDAVGVVDVFCFYIFLARGRGSAQGRRIALWHMRNSLSRVALSVDANDLATNLGWRAVRPASIPPPTFTPPSLGPLQVLLPDLHCEKFGEYILVYTYKHWNYHSR